MVKVPRTPTDASLMMSTVPPAENPAAENPTALPPAEVQGKDRLHKLTAIAGGPVEEEEEDEHMEFFPVPAVPTATITTDEEMLAPASLSHQKTAADTAPAPLTYTHTG